MLNSFISAFLMYSRIPMPKVAWKDENRRYALGFFPLVGAVIGLLLLIWYFICTNFVFGKPIFAAGAVALPVFVTGGIHMDGFCDVCDAKASCAEKDKKLEIMSDPHIGSFAVIRLCLCFIIQAALFSEVCKTRTVLVIACGHVVSRVLSGVSAITFKAAKKSGSLQSFTQVSHKKMTLVLLCVFGTAAVSAMMAANAITGCFVMFAALGVFLYYRYSAYKEFGGTTGDLCGWFLQLCEIWMLAAAVICERAMEVFL